MRILDRGEVIKELSERDGFFCFLCKKDFDEDPTLDHWHPVSWCRKQGWSEQEINDISNLRLAHKKCNSKKSDLVPIDDSTLPERNVDKRVRLPRPEVCTTCNAGRNLSEYETCLVCQSEPMPRSYPRWAKLSPRECPHSGPWWCWLEALEPNLRQPAFVDVLGEP
jgi:hypothetical protein